MRCRAAEAKVQPINQHIKRNISKAATGCYEWQERAFAPHSASKRIKDNVWKHAAGLTGPLSQRRAEGARAQSFSPSETIYPKAGAHGTTKLLTQQRAARAEFQPIRNSTPKQARPADLLAHAAESSRSSRLWRKESRFELTTETMS